MIEAATREEWQEQLHELYFDRTRGICFCAVHCQESPYHENACCRGWCDCWCHLQ